MNSNKYHRKTRLNTWLIFSLSFGLIFALNSAQAQGQMQLSDGTELEDSPLWILAYIEVEPQATEAAQRLLNAYARMSRESNGNLSIEAVQRIGRPNHFAILESWSNPEAREAHAASAYRRAFLDALLPMLYSPYDERPHFGLATAPRARESNDESIYAITHADVIRPQQFPPCDISPDPSGPCANALLIDLAEQSRTMPGSIGFDVLTQANRANHMSVIEVWDSAEAQAAFQTHPDTKTFRYALFGMDTDAGANEDPQFIPSPMLGSLWDERLYRAF